MLRKSLYLILSGLKIIQFLDAQESPAIINLMKHVQILASDSMEGRGFGFTGKRAAVAYIAGEFESAGLEPVNGRYIIPFLHQAGSVRVEGLNVAGMIKGTDPALNPEYIVIGAHLDHLGYEMKGGEQVVFNGADDNASGVSALIEISRRLVQKKEFLKRSVILVAFDGEESGLIGSGNFVTGKTVDPDRVKIMFSLDMVGNYEKNKGVEFNGLASLLTAEETLREIASAKGIQLRKGKETIEMRTDTWSFAREKIPAVHVYTGETRTYHKPDDDSDLLDYQGMSMITDLMADFTVSLAGMDKLQANARVMGKSTDPFFLAGFSYRIGPGNFHYQDEFFNAKSMLGLEAGLETRFKITKNLIIQPAVMYSSNASQSDEGNVRMHSVSPQISILLTTSNNRKDLPFGYLLAGSYYKYHFAGTVSGKSADFESVYRHDETGLQFGLGLQVYMFQIGFMGKYGMTGIFRDEFSIGAQSTGRYFSFTYFF
jgi:hypothetical protein